MSAWFSSFIYSLTLAGILVTLPEQVIWLLGWNDTCPPLTTVISLSGSWSVSVDLWPLSFDEELGKRYHHLEVLCPCQLHLFRSSPLLALEYLSQTVIFVDPEVVVDLSSTLLCGCVVVICLPSSSIYFIYLYCICSRFTSGVGATKYVS